MLTLVLFADFPILKELKESKLVDFSAFEHCWRHLGTNNMYNINLVIFFLF